GQVISLKSEYRSSDRVGSYSYYPIVRYTTDNHVSVEFKDSIGGNPPSYRVGDRVTVLYLADNPRKQAIIDRGMFWNWAIPVLLLLGAGLLFWLFIVMRRPAPNPGSLTASPIRVTS